MQSMMGLFTLIYNSGTDTKLIYRIITDVLIWTGLHFSEDALAEKY